MVEKVFLTDARRAALENYDPDSSNHRTHKSRTTDRAATAFEELLWVAQSPLIDHREVFPPEKVRALLVTLLAGGGGFGGDYEPTDQMDAWTPDPEDRDAWYVATERAQLHVERQADPSDIYEMYGEKAAALREFHEEQPETPDDRDIYDIGAVDQCNRCEWSPAGIVLTDQGDTKGWECYNCGADPDE